MRRMPWDGRVDVLVCDNLLCLRYRNPISIPHREETPEDEASLAERQEVSRLERKTTKKLQELRWLFHPKEE